MLRVKELKTNKTYMVYDIKIHRNHYQKDDFDEELVQFLIFDENLYHWRYAWANDFRPVRVTEN